ncbi:MAG: cytochrome c3 family protein [Opitutales bacterium]
MANIFPKWSNVVPIKLVVALVFIGTAVTAGITYYATPKYTRVGYQPTQPVAFSHQLHSEQLGMDCRYCHTHVDKSGHSNVPTTETCMACHSMIRSNDSALALVRESYDSGEAIPWVRIHAAPDYVYFNHAAHVNRGVSCVDCHGRIDQMEVVYHDQPLSMGWCLECHRAPEEYIRPLDKIYDLGWQFASLDEQVEWGTEHVEKWKVNPPQSCSGCHR